MNSATVSGQLFGRFVRRRVSSRAELLVTTGTEVGTRSRRRSMQRQTTRTDPESLFRATGGIVRSPREPKNF
jgi:hypothetical protein